MNIGTVKKYQELMQEFSKTPREDVMRFKKKYEEVLSEFLKLEEVYIIVYNDMFNRSSLYDYSDIINYQIMFNKSIKKKKKILNGFKVKGV